MKKVIAAVAASVIGVGAIVAGVIAYRRNCAWS